MPANALVVVIDGLRASALGAYGNTSFATPALDSFAAESLLFDSCFAPSADLIEIYRALWHSKHPARSLENSPGKAGVDSKRSLPRMFAERGYETTLVSDERSLNSLAAVADFDEVVPASDSWETIQPNDRVDDPSKTEFAHLFTAATHQINRPVPTSKSAGRNADKPRLVWLHARGMYGAWDAPLAFQQSLLDEGDPPPLESVMPPDFAMKPGDDPDIVFQLASAYAAQVMVLDACWENFFNDIRAADGDEWLVMLMGARGFPLGEHDRIGGVDSRLYADQLHVPWLIRFPEKLGRLARSDALTCHLDVLPTLIDWMNASTKFDSSAFDGTSVLPFASATRSSWRDALISSSATTRAIRTPAWFLREDKSAETSSLPELYVRPDDRWEANDVAKLCPEVIEELRALPTGLAPPVC